MRWPAHAEIMVRRKEWFERMAESHLVLWWVREGHRPSVSQAISRLELLRSAGSTPEAFTFRQAYPPPGEAHADNPFDIGGECPAL
jgi:hypothetical protein